MASTYIDIEKTLIPYRFSIKINSVSYTFLVKYNASSEFFTVDLFKGTKTLVYGEKIVYGNPLFSPTTVTQNGKKIIIPKTPDYPKAIIMPWDLARKETRVTYDNFGVTVFLFMVTEADLNV